jgi:hypothetical protein
MITNVQLTLMVLKSKITTVLVCLVWLYSLLMAAMYPDNGLLLNILVQSVMLTYFVSVSIVYHLKLANTPEQNIQPNVVHGATVTPSPALAALISLDAATVAKPKTTIRKPRRTKEDIAKAKNIKAAKEAVAKATATALQKKASN